MTLGSAKVGLLFFFFLLLFFKTQKRKPLWDVVLIPQSTIMDMHAGMHIHTSLIESFLTLWS